MASRCATTRHSFELCLTAPWVHRGFTALSNPHTRPPSLNLRMRLFEQIDISHQEMDRIIGELEAIYQSQPTAWLPVESIGMMLTHELGYEDVEEFEDALKSTFSQFLAALPHIELQEVDGKEVSAGLLPFRDSLVQTLKHPIASPQPTQQQNAALLFAEIQGETAAPTGITERKGVHPALDLQGGPVACVP
eukprot:1088102-Prorocentrum_minimum.AAC.3